MLSTAHHWKRAKNRKGQENGETQHRAHWTQVRTSLARVQISEEVDLRSQKKQQEHQADGTAI
jgi:hypothetical protein